MLPGFETDLAENRDFLITVLGSGSAGNSTLLKVGSAAYLIDLGLSATRLCEGATRLGIPALHPTRKQERRVSLDHGVRLEGALLTHTHDDHVREAALRFLHHNGATLWAHDSHAAALEPSPWFGKLAAADKVKTFARAPVQLGPSLFVKALRLPHDSIHTFGFVFHYKSPSGQTHKFSYLADLGEFPSAFVREVADSDVLALEFNHDEELERRSGRAPSTIARVLGPYGHLSNEQAAQALGRILKASRNRPHHVILLHLSRECNRELLAKSEAQKVLDRYAPAAKILVAKQDQALPPISLFGRNGTQ